MTFLHTEISLLALGTMHFLFRIQITDISHVISLSSGPKRAKSPLDFFHALFTVPSAQILSTCFIQNLFYFLRQQFILENPAHALPRDSTSLELLDPAV